MPRKTSDATPPDLSEEEARLLAEVAAYAATESPYTSYQESDDGDLGPPPDLGAALAQLAAAGDADRAAATEAKVGVARQYLGVAPALIDDMAWLWRTQASVSERIALARGLWDSGVHDAMLTAAKLLTQARLRPDDDAWDLIFSWAPRFEDRATADAACAAGARRLLAVPARLDRIAPWCTAPNALTRRAVLTMTQPFARLNHPDSAQEQVRTQVLDWCNDLARDSAPVVAQAVGSWIKDLAKHDADAAARWRARNG